MTFPCVSGFIPTTLPQWAKFANMIAYQYPRTHTRTQSPDLMGGP